MTFFTKIKAALIRFMQGRYGADMLGTVTMWSGLLFWIAGAFTGFQALSVLGLVFYVLTLWRMFSRKVYKRAEENRRFLSFFYNIKTKIRQFFLRLKNSKVYKYFKCPQCRVLLRLKRGSGEKQIHCPRCGHDFTHKA